MKRLRQWLHDILMPEDLNDLNIEAIASALNEHEVRRVWLQNVFSEIKRINLEVDKRLLYGHTEDVKDLCASRQTIQRILESALSAKLSIGLREPHHNPRPVGGIDLDRVTV